MKNALFGMSADNVTNSVVVTVGLLLELVFYMAK